MAWRDWLPNWLSGLSEGDEPVEPFRMLRHFKQSLENEFLVAKVALGATPGPLQPIVDHISDLLKVEPPRWDAAYEVERLLVQLKPSILLERDLDRRIAEAENAKLPLTPVFKAQQDDLKSRAAQLTADEIDEHRRAMLFAITENLQWAYAKRFVVRQHLWQGAHVLPSVGIIVFLFAGLPYMAFLVQKITGLQCFTALMNGMPNYGLFSAISFGLIGAFFSRLLALQGGAANLTVEDAQQMFKTSFIVVRAAVGMIGALIFYFLLSTGLIEKIYLGTFVPNFSNLNFVEKDVMTMFGKVKVLVPSNDWSLLLIWSLLAGFSERLVPDTLSRVEKRLAPSNPGQATKDSAAATEKPKP